MKSLFISTCFLFCLSSFAYEIGDKVNNFELAGYPSKTSLESLKGQYVVLEWYNNGCPFVRKHYNSQNIQKMQRNFKGKVAWLTINSSAEGKQGYIADTDVAKSLYEEEKMASTALLIDSSGKVGQRFEAKTTPHFFILDPEGRLVYQGAVDSIASADPSDIEKADNYVVAALKESLEGKEISAAKTRPYGCSVKY